MASLWPLCNEQKNRFLFLAYVRISLYELSNHTLYRSCALSMASLWPLYDLSMALCVASLWLSVWPLYGLSMASLCINFLKC